MMTNSIKPVTQKHNLKCDDSAFEIINKIRGDLEAQGQANPNTSEVIRELYRSKKLGQKLCSQLLAFAGEFGDNEGASDVLDRLLGELVQLRKK